MVKCWGCGEEYNPDIVYMNALYWTIHLRFKYCLSCRDINRDTYQSGLPEYRREVQNLKATVDFMDTDTWEAILDAV